jgi:Ca2+-binding RTX toxin-like protein
MPTLRAAALPAALALAALLPATTHAGSVSAGMVLAFSAGPGEANQVSVVRAGDRIVFTDVLPIAESTPLCDGGGTTVVTCAPAAVTVDLDDLDDGVTIGPLGDAIRAEASGGDGADRLDAAGASGYVALSGGAGGDALHAGAGESDLTGGDGDDALSGGPDGAFTTYLMGAAADGADVLTGGAGFDVAGYSQRTLPLQLTADGLAADDGAVGEGDRIGPAVERLEGGSAPDLIAASPLTDAELSGGGGNDRLAGGPGADLLSGGDGDDDLSGGAGDDTAAPSAAIAAPGDDGAGPGESDGDAVDAGSDAFAGGPGFDTLSYATRSAPVTASLDGLANDGEANERDNPGADVEALTGGRGADTLTGSVRAERVIGGSGNDTIDPGGGVDEVRAGDGSDAVRAQDATAEWISCGLGSDTLAADFNDVPVACESVTLAPVPPGADTRKPRVRIDSLPPRPRYRHVRRGLRPRLSANERVAYVVELLGAARVSMPRPFNLTLVRRTIPATSSPRRISLRPRASLLGPRRKLRVRIRVTATDMAGNVRIVRKTVRAHR